VATTTGGRNASLAERLAAREDQLSRAEQSVARFMAENPQEVAFSSAEELGRLTGTSDATVIRTVKALGYSGLPSLKRTLQTSLREHLTPVGRLSHSLETIDADRGHLLDSVLAEQIRVLEATRRSIRPEEFTKAVAAIRNARYVLTYSVGMHGRLADYFTTRMLRQGRHARASADSGFLLADSLVPLREGDAVILITTKQIKPEDLVVIDHARRVGAKIVLITDTLGAALGDKVDAILTADAGQRDRVSYITISITIMEALVLGLAAEERESVSESVEVLVEIRERLAETVAKDVAANRRRPARRRPRQAISPDGRPAQA
jgi:DNA-binding MurR/RpiR family transcriptional regulator